MPTTSATEHGPDPAASTTPMLRADATLQLSAQTLACLADRPHVRKFVRSVWDKLIELERAGHHPDVIAALRSVLIYHQPSTPKGRCRSCRSFTWRRLWRRQPFPCTAWMNIYLQLLGPFADGGHGPPV